MTKPVNKIEKLIAAHCPNGVEFKELGEVITSLRTGLNPRQNFKLNPPDAKNYYITVRELCIFDIRFSDKTDRVDAAGLALIQNRSNLQVGDVLFSGTGTIGRTALVSEEPSDWNIKEGIYAITPNHKTLNSRFLIHLLNSENVRLHILAKADGSTVSSIPMAALRKITIPVPPFAIQQEIVKILDTFTTLEAELEAELEARKKQYEYYFNNLLSFDRDIEVLTLGDIANYRRGSFPQPYGEKRWYDGEGAMPFVQVADVGKDMRLVNDTKNKISKLAQRKSVFVSKGTVIVTLQGSIGRVAITQYDSYVDRTLAIFESFKTDIDKKYFAYQLQKKFHLERESARGSTIKTITKEEFTKFKIPIPLLAEQERIVVILDKFDALVNDISVGLPAELNARRKQYEYYRNKLLTFEPLEKEYANQ